MFPQHLEHLQSYREWNCGTPVLIAKCHIYHLDIAEALFWPTMLNSKLIWEVDIGVITYHSVQAFSRRP